MRLLTFFQGKIVMADTQKDSKTPEIIDRREPKKRDRRRRPRLNKLTSNKAKKPMDTEPKTTYL
jgi:hypothetical protein